MSLHDILEGVRAGNERTDIPESWAQGRATFGGLLTGLSLQACQSADERPVRSVLTTFVGPVAPGEVEIDTEVLRTGRSVSHTQVRLLQEGSIRVVVQVVRGQDRPTEVAWQAAAPPVLPDPETLLHLPYIEGVTPTFTHHFDYRWRDDRLPFSGANVPALGGYVRLRQPAPTTPAVLVALLDAWPAPVLPLASHPFPASTASWMVCLAEPPGKLPAQAWYRYEAETTASQAGYADVTSRLWTDDGRLLATSRQLVTEFSART